jgi:hypothetical protein
VLLVSSPRRLHQRLQILIHHDDFLFVIICFTFVV